MPVGRARAGRHPPGADAGADIAGAQGDRRRCDRPDRRAGAAARPGRDPHTPRGGVRQAVRRHPRSEIGAGAKGGRASGAVVVFKGPDTLVASPDGQLGFAPPAPAWLASAGTGDVLAGMIAAMRARGMTPFEAACAAVWLHGRAAEIAGPQMIADDLVAAIPDAIACCERTDRPNRGARRRGDGERPPRRLRRCRAMPCSTMARLRLARITRSRHAAISPSAAAASSSMPTTRPIAVIWCRG